MHGIKGNWMIIEACVENINEAIRAEAQGAHRVEICENLIIGGTTPSAGTIAIAKKVLNIPIMVLIRPRGGDFVYSDLEVEIMKHDIQVCKQIGIDGVVLGTLTEENTINTKLLNELVNLAKPLDITFHKAIDETIDIVGEFKRLLAYQIDRILTSGGAESVYEGQQTINEMTRLSDGKIKIIAAGKIHQSDLSNLQKIIKTNEFHGKKIVGDLSNSSI